MIWGVNYNRGQNLPPPPTTPADNPPICHLLVLCSISKLIVLTNQFLCFCLTIQAIIYLQFVIAFQDYFSLVSTVGTSKSHTRDFILTLVEKNFH